MLSFRIFEDASFQKKLRAVPEDDEGIDIEFLRREIKKSEDKAKADNNAHPVSFTRSAQHTSMPVLSSGSGHLMICTRCGIA
jgi:hypothetical protein